MIRWGERNPLRKHLLIDCNGLALAKEDVVQGEYVRRVTTNMTGRLRKTKFARSVDSFCLHAFCVPLSRQYG